jgi:hypothetical protein
MGGATAVEVGLFSRLQETLGEEESPDRRDRVTADLFGTMMADAVSVV